MYMLQMNRLNDRIDFSIVSSYDNFKLRATFRHKINIIIDTGGKGKSFLCSSIREELHTAAQYHSSITSITQDLPDLAQLLNRSDYKLVFIDEDALPTSVKHPIWDVINKSPACFVIVHRNVPSALNVHADAVYRLVSSAGWSTLKSIRESVFSTNTVDCILTEDSKSGYEFSVLRFGKDNVISAGNKTGISLYAQKLMHRRLLVLADLANFGTELQSIQLLRNIHLANIESFENELLRTYPIFHGWIGREDYFSPVTVERWSTAEMTRMMTTCCQPYSKSRLSVCLTGVGPHTYKCSSCNLLANCKRDYQNKLWWAKFFEKEGVEFE